MPYEVLRPIPVLIWADGEEFIASFIEANINASGETQQEAFENVKALILDVFDSLRSHSPEKLGPDPARRLAVLRDFLHDTGRGPSPLGGRRLATGGG